MAASRLLLFFIIPLFATVCNGGLYSAYTSPNTLHNRETMVHLFEWKWTDIASECETFLSKYGYGAVQVSPPNEHLMMVDGDKNMPWWIRYQPVSYKLDRSRSGTRQEFTEMVDRCHKVGVRIVVDAVINHMANMGTKYPGSSGVWSSAGTEFDGTHGVESFPGVPYINLDFHDDQCDHSILQSDYTNNSWGVRTCRLGDLLDLNHNSPYVRRMISAYFNDLIDLGVAGIRIDAAKHMWPFDISAILDEVKNVKEDIYGSNKRPFIVQEVIDHGGESVMALEYADNGRITQFNYGVDVAAAIRRKGNFKNFTNYGRDWAYGYFPDEVSLVFIDNHDNQRDDPNVLTYQRDGWKYIMGVTYMLAWPYGYARVMSSYSFTTRDQGPPNTGSPNWTTKLPTFEKDETCSQASGWLCEHRIPAIRRMVTFRSIVSGEQALDIVSSDNRIAFRRGNKGFFALNNADSDWKQQFSVGMPAGTYCDIISGEYDDQAAKCTGLTVEVDPSGHINTAISPNTTLAIHIGQRASYF